MTKLEEKLIELGYSLNNIDYLDGKPLYKHYYKIFDYCYIEASVCQYKSPFSLKINLRVDSFKLQEVIDDFNKAFNVMKKDLEVLKSVED